VENFKLARIKAFKPFPQVNQISP